MSRGANQILNRLLLDINNINCLSYPVGHYRLPALPRSDLPHAADMTEMHS